MYLPFSRGGGGGGDHDIEQPPRPPQPPLPPRAHVPSDELLESQPYYKPSSPVKEEPYGYGHHATNMPATAGGEGKNRGARAAAQGHVAEVNKNGGGGRMTDFVGYSDDDVGVVRDRQSQSAAGKIAASTTPATQAFNNKHRDLGAAAAQQAPQRVSASPRHHGHGSLAASLHPSEAAAVNMKAPLPVLPMARRPLGGDYY